MMFKTTGGYLYEDILFNRALIDVRGVKTAITMLGDRLMVRMKSENGSYVVALYEQDEVEVSTDELRMKNPIFFCLLRPADVLELMHRAARDETAADLLHRILDLDEMVLREEHFVDYEMLGCSIKMGYPRSALYQGGN